MFDRQIQIYKKTIYFFGKNFKKMAILYILKAKIVGYRDTGNTSKTCPNFDVKAWVKNDTLYMNVINSSIIMKSEPSNHLFLKLNVCLGKS